jgi:TPR repeat protein
MHEMGVHEWSQAWLAFRELKGCFNHTAEQWERLRKHGWFDDLRFFASHRKRIAERVASSPYFFAVAYRVGGDPYVEPYVGGNMTHPDRVAAELAKRTGPEEAATFFKYRISEAILQFNLDMGLSYLRSSHNTIALKRLTLAAEQGSAVAQLALGRMYAEGVSAPQDHLLAHKWLNLAAYRLSEVDRGQALKLRQTVSKVLASDRLIEAEMLARQWVPKTWDELTNLGDPLTDQIEWN